MSAQQRCAFTLMELLVVISIMAILASMMMPIIKLVRDAARGTTCMNSLRQLGMGAQAYATDYDGLLVPMNTGAGATMPWMELLHPYLDEGSKVGTVNISRRGVIWGCPTWRTSPAYNAGNSWLTGYGINAYPWRDGNIANYNRWTNITGPPAGEWCTLSTVAKPGMRPLFADCANWWILTLPGWMCDPRHRSRVQAVYFDGHADSATLTDLSSAFDNP